MPGQIQLARYEQSPLAQRPIKKFAAVVAVLAASAVGAASVIVVAAVVAAAAAATAVFYYVFVLVMVIIFPVPVHDVMTTRTLSLPISSLLLLRFVVAILCGVCARLPAQEHHYCSCSVEAGNIGAA